MEHGRQSQRRNLTEHGRPCRTCHAQFRTAEQTVDHDRVKHDVRQCACHLCDCRIKRTTGRLQGFLKHREEQNAERGHTADAQVLTAHRQSGRVARLRADVRTRTERAEQQAHRINNSYERQRIACRCSRLLSVTLTKRACDKRICADTGADADGDHHHLHRKRKCQRVDRDFTFFRHVCHKIAVHNVVDRLQHHR